MIPVDQVARGVAAFYDSEVRPSLSQGKGILYGMAVGRIASGAPQLLERYSSILTPLGLAEGENLDVEGISVELKQQMQKSGGGLSVRILQDEFTFKPQDVDALMRCIERA